MGEYSIHISDSAKQDIRGIAAYITHELLEPVIAESTTEAILAAISTLEDMPNRIGLVNDGRLSELRIRRLLIKNYSVFFRINEAYKVVEIVRVIYSRRDWASLL